jgi:hypothetical protein
MRESTKDREPIIFTEENKGNEEKWKMTSYGLARTPKVNSAQPLNHNPGRGDSY